MATIMIREIRKTGELRWGIILIDEENRSILESIEPLSKGTAPSVAKALKQGGSDSSAWSKKDGELKFVLVSETTFRLLEKEEGPTGIPEVVKVFLGPVEIKWDPPDADPAYKEKQADRTPTKGIAGS